MRKIFLLACIASIVLAAPAAGWADDCFLALAGPFGDTPGGPFGSESIALLGWSWGGAVDLHSPAGIVAGNPPVPEIRFLKRIGAPSSVNLQKARHARTLLMGGRLACYQIYGRGDAYLKLEFNDVRVLEIQTRYVPGQTPPVPIESVAIGFSRIKMDAAPIRQDGTLGPPVLFGWDYANNRLIEFSSPGTGSGSGTQGTGGTSGSGAAGPAPTTVSPVLSPAKVIPPPTTPQPVKK